MRKILFVSAAALILFFEFTACPTESDSVSTAAVIITGADLTELLGLPRGGLQMQSGIDGNRQFSGSVIWEINSDGFWDEVMEGGIFQAGAKYRARLTLTAKKGYTFTGTGANSFSYIKGSAANPAGTGAGTTLTVTVNFPIAPEKSDNTVTQTDLTPILAAPVKGGNPEAAFDFSQYSGTIIWQTGDGVPVDSATGIFEPSTVYQAIVTLTPKTGWTLSGLTNGSSLIHSAAQNCSLDLTGGKVTILFKPTVGAGDSVVSIYNLTGLLSNPVWGTVSLTTTVETGQYTGTVSWFYNDNTAITGPVAGGKDFRVIVFLNAKDGFTFNGVPPNIFCHSQMKSANNTAGSGKTMTVTVYFDKVLGVITYPRLGAGGLGAVIKGCCYPDNNNKPPRLINSPNPSNPVDYGNFWDFLWNGNTEQGYENLTDWPEYFNEMPSNLDPQNGHPSVFNKVSVPPEFRRPAHVFTIDLGSKIDNIVSLGMYPKWNGTNPTYWPVWFQVFYSDTDIGPIPGPEAAALPEIKWGATDGKWRDANLWELNGKKPISARYINLRIYMISADSNLIYEDTTAFADNIQLGAALAQLRVGLSDEY